MRRTLACAALLGAVLTATMAPAVSAQTLASIAAAGAPSGAAAVEKAGCWGCQQLPMVGVCQGGHVPGYWNCVGGLETANNCNLSSPGCGGGALLPLDPDGATQYVSRGAAIGLEEVLSAKGQTVRRNCEGVVVARYQTPDNISSVRARTGSLTL